MKDFYTENDSPQPQVRDAFGLLNEKPLIKSLDNLVEDSSHSPYDWYFRGLSILAEGNDFMNTLSFINGINLHTLKIISKEMLKMFSIHNNF